MISLQNLLNIAIIITPPLAMLSGLFMAPWISILMILILSITGINLYNVRNNFNLSERLLILYSICTCIWSISIIESITTASRLICIISLAYIISNKSTLFQTKSNKISLFLTLGFVISVIIFSIDAYTDGAAYRLIRTITQPTSKSHFELYWLDRGVAFLSVCSWALIYLFIKNQHIWRALLLYISTLTVLFFSDSTAGLLAYFLAGITYLGLYFSKMKLALTLSVLVIFYIFIMPIFAVMQNPRYIVSEFKNIPISYAHRLFIWKFTAEKSMEKPWVGHGIGASRAIPIEKTDIIEYNNHNLSPLPIHPHNNIMQIWLEMGAFGLFLMAYYISNIFRKLRGYSDYRYAATLHAVFINYFVIDMISFNIWQSWWMMTILFIVLIMNMVRDCE